MRDDEKCSVESVGKACLLLRENGFFSIADVVERHYSARFPVMSDVKNPGPAHIPWDVAEKAYSVYRTKYGSQQSLERLAERGGFYTGELDGFYPKWREEAGFKVRFVELQETHQLKTGCLGGCRSEAEHQKYSVHCRRHGI